MFRLDFASQSGRQNESVCSSIDRAEPGDLSASINRARVIQYPSGTWRNEIVEILNGSIFPNAGMQDAPGDSRLADNCSLIVLAARVTLVSTRQCAEIVNVRRSIPINGYSVGVLAGVSCAHRDAWVIDPIGDAILPAR
jgi:hypothetical protein